MKRRQEEGGEEEEDKGEGRMSVKTNKKDMRKRREKLL